MDLARLTVAPVVPDGVRMWLPATWTSLEARDPGAPELHGELPDSSGCVVCSMIWSEAWRRRMDRERERLLLALLEWEECVERWLRIPAPDLEVFVQGLAGLMARQANRRGRSDERVVADQEPSP